MGVRISEGGIDLLITLHYLSSDDESHLDHLEKVELHAALRVDLLRLARAHLIIDVINHVT